jgi:putative polyhydroxyalkanoate system protein
MSKIHMKYKHALDPQETRDRVEEIAKDLKREYKIDYAWKGDRLLFRRSGAAGNLDLGDGFIELDINLGLVLSPMKGKIEQAIKQNIAAKMSGKSGEGLA